MLWDSSAFNRYAIKASDGQIGSVSDLLFEDTSWIARWLVVDTRHWLFGRKVLLPFSALKKPDPSLRQFPVKLTMQQVKDSPDIDTDRPVSRQHETHIYRHYGWDPYWGGTFFPMGGGMAMPFIEAEATLFGAAGEGLQQAKDDSHLRSVGAVTGFHVRATDGEIGHVEDLLVDDDDWNIRYVKVKVDTKNWRSGSRVLISPRSVRSIDQASRSFYLDVDRRKVENSPAYDPSRTVDGAYDTAFLTYYGTKRTQP